MSAGRLSAVPLGPADMDPVDVLIQVELVKHVQARYFRLQDLGLWEEWAELFTKDVRYEFPVATGRGRETLVKLARDRLAGGRSAHHGHMPEITIKSPTEAEGIWAMGDDVEKKAEGGRRTRHFGSGHYYQDFVRDEQGWRISAVRLVRLRVDQTDTFSDHLG